MITDLSLRYLVSPVTDAKLPLVLMLHGRGADMHDLADLADLLAAPGSCRFVFANAPRPFEPAPGMSFGWTWFDGWPPEGPSVKASRELLLTFIGELIERYQPPGLVLAGFSQGAMMALDAGLRSDVAGIVAMSGGLYENDLPDLSAKKGLPVLIAHGIHDDVVPVHFARRARHVLEDAGLDVEYHEYPMQHQVAQEEVDAVRRFLAARLLEKRPE
ncbi:MAG TPA: phospholipase [Thermoanaerobaculia bacterium]|nr:phospholipase [Thermoanaerobaculia bacterium]